MRDRMERPAPVPSPGLLTGFARRRILVLGDVMADEYIWGTVSRISPEAGL
jgi:bifunctional ADP-heptose synthase (sugar kinase/adenylyltransferase)